MLDILLSPFSEVPVRNKLHTRWLGLAIFGGWCVLYILLTAFNVVLQGHVNSYTTVLQPTPTTNDSLTCPPAVFRVGDSITTKPQGLLPWQVSSVDGDRASAFGYTDSLPTCSMHNGGLTYSFQSQSFILGACGNCSYPSNSSTPAVTVTFCTSYDIQRASLPDWTAEKIGRLQARTYSIHAYYQRLAFPSGSFDPIALPPYGEVAEVPAVVDSSITPRQLVNINTWINGFRYAAPQIGMNGSYTFPDNSVAADLSAVYDVSVPAAAGLIMNVAGIGAIRFGSVNSSSVQVPGQPAVIADLRRTVFDAIDLLLELTLADLNGRAIAATYVCTQAHRELKPFFSLLALVIGANAGIMTSFLAVTLWAAGSWDKQRARFSVGCTPLTTPWSPRLEARTDIYDLAFEEKAHYETYDADKLDYSAQKL